MIETVNVVELYDNDICSIRSFTIHEEDEAYKVFAQIVKEHNTDDDGETCNLTDEDIESLGGYFDDDNGYSCQIKSSEVY